MSIPKDQRITYRRYFAKIGDNLIKIAKNFKVPVNAIVDVNNSIISKHSIEAGEFYFIPINLHK